MTANTSTEFVEPIDPQSVYAVLICDLVGLRFGPDGKPDPSEVRAHIEAKGRSLPRRCTWRQSRS